MPYQDFKDPAIAHAWDTDTRSFNPYRSEQLDMLLSIIADHYKLENTILDLGMGTGLVEVLLFNRIPQALVVGVDASEAMLERAHQKLTPFASQYITILHDLTAIDTLQLPERRYQIVFSVQTLHHLTDAQMLATYQFIHTILEAGGLFLLSDRIAVEHSGLYSVYQSLWRRQDTLYESQVVSAEGATFADHQRIVAERGDLPIGLERHLELLKTSGFEASCVQLQTNRALLVGRKA